MENRMTWVVLILGVCCSLFCGITLVSGPLDNEHFKSDVLMFLGIILGFVVSFLAIAIERGVIF